MFLVLLCLLLTFICISLLYFSSRISKKIRLLEEKIIDDSRKLTLLDQVQFNLISNLGHELRNPLTTVKEDLALVLDESCGKINDNQKKFLSLAASNTNRLSRLINDLLDLSRIKAGKMGVQRTSLSLTGLIDDVISSMRMQIHTKGLVLEKHIQPDLPNVYADEDRISQVVTNLLNNAVKFTSVSGRVTIKAERLDERYVQTSVVDTGVGIKPEDIHKIFNKFQQYDPTLTRQTQGMGLGLAISKGIIEAHGGVISASSVPGQGSTFSFTLPLYELKLDFEKCLDEEFEYASEHGTSFSLIMVYIKNFEDITAAYPGLIPKILRGLEGKIKQVMFGPNDRVIDQIERHAFAILARADEKGTLSIIERVKKNIAKYVPPVKGVTIEVDFSIARYPDDAQTREDILHKIREVLMKI